MSYNLTFDESMFMMVQAEARSEGRSVEEYVLEGVLKGLREAKQCQRVLSGEAFLEAREFAIREALALSPGSSLGEVTQWFPMECENVSERVSDPVPRGGSGGAPWSGPKGPRQGRGPRVGRGASRAR